MFPVASRRVIALAGIQAGRAAARWDGRAEAGGLATAGGRAAAVDGDHDQSAVPVGRRGDDDRHPPGQEPVGLGQAAGGAVGAGRVVAVVAQVRREEEGERRGDTGLGQVAGQRPERHDVRVAEGLVPGDRPEEREPVVAGGVLVAQLGVPGAVSGPGGGVATGRQLVAERGDRRSLDNILVITDD